jgi:tetratricopeptide (TPR) repeat protein
VSISDQPLAEYQVKLLDLAFQTASAIPKNPHIKDRSRAQEAVVTACLKLEQPGHAAQYCEGIDDWRRGLCFAELAFYYAKRGAVEPAKDYLAKARKICDEAQDWRKDTINVKMAQVLVLLGQNDQASQYEIGVVDSQKGKVAGIRAMQCDEGAFDEQMQALASLGKEGGFDILQNIEQAYAVLFNRFYSDTQRRDRTEREMKSLWNTMPYFIRMELLMTLAGFALNHGDAVKALELVHEADQLVKDGQWRLDHRISIIAGLSALRFRAGDTVTARNDCDAVLGLYDAQRLSIVNIDRARTLHKLAEAYQVMGDTETALMVYKKAVEEGVENPNSRPRAEDLSAACCSLALSAVEPDAELWDRLNQIREGLSQPW